MCVCVCTQARESSHVRCVCVSQVHTRARAQKHTQAKTTELGNGENRCLHAVAGSGRWPEGVNRTGQGGAQGVGEAAGVLIELALMHQALVALIDELNRVLDGEYMALLRFQNTIDEGRERCGLARACRACAKNKPSVFFGEINEGLW